MSDQKKIPAFTLSEMLVVLLITTIVVGMAFSVLNLVQRQMQGIGINFERTTELNLLKQSLWIDFNQSDGIWYNAREAQLLCINELRELTYTFHADFVVKEQDTFRIKGIRQKFFFKGEAQASGEVDALDISTSREMREQQFFIYKQNAATSFVNE